jgi:hypothetical protein
VDASAITALAALLGGATSGLTSVLATWLKQRTQARAVPRSGCAAPPSTRGFIEEAAKGYDHARYESGNEPSQMSSLPKCTTACRSCKSLSSSSIGQTEIWAWRSLSTLPCLTLRPRGIRPRRMRPPGAAACKANQASEAARGVPLPFVPARAASPVRLLKVTQGQRHDDETQTRQPDPRDRSSRRCGRHRPQPYRGTVRARFSEDEPFFDGNCSRPHFGPVGAPPPDRWCVVLRSASRKSSQQRGGGNGGFK